MPKTLLPIGNNFPIIMVKRKPFRSYTERALSETEYEKLLGACERFEDTCLLLLGVRFGLRRQDVINIQVSNVNLDAGKIRFHECKKSALRELPIPSDILPWFKQYITNLPANQKTLFSYNSDRNCHARLQYLCTKVGIKTPLPFHSLRGTCYKRCRYIYKWSLEQSAAWLGDTVSIAAQHYGKVSDGELADLVK